MSFYSLGVFQTVVNAKGNHNDKEKFHRTVMKQISEKFEQDLWAFFQVKMRIWSSSVSVFLSVNFGSDLTFYIEYC